MKHLIQNVAVVSNMPVSSHQLLSHMINIDVSYDFYPQATKGCKKFVNFFIIISAIFYYNFCYLKFFLCVREKILCEGQDAQARVWGFFLKNKKNTKDKKSKR